MRVDYRTQVSHNLATDLPHPYQPLRDFVATIVHEMIHVAQWEKNEWYETDGEKECEDLQYKLTDELWRKNIL